MPTTNGAFILDTSDPIEIDGVTKQRMNVMFVFAADPFDIKGRVRVKLTPANRNADPAKDWLLGEAAQLLLQAIAPEIIIALNDGTATFKVTSMLFDYPIDFAETRAPIEAQWRRFSDAGQRTLAAKRYEFGGIWLEFEPTR